MAELMQIVVVDSPDVVGTPEEGVNLFVQDGVLYGKDSTGTVTKLSEAGSSFDLIKTDAIESKTGGASILVESSLLLNKITQFEKEQKIKEIATPAGNPAAGYVFEYIKADGNRYRKDNAGNETLANVGLIESEDGLIADVAQTQADGTPITKEYSRFGTVANTDDAATLPEATKNKRFVIMNDGANSMGLFPAIDDNFEGLAADVKTDIVSASLQEMICLIDGEWLLLS